RVGCVLESGGVGVGDVEFADTAASVAHEGRDISARGFGQVEAKLRLRAEAGRDDARIQGCRGQDRAGVNVEIREADCRGDAEGGIAYLVVPNRVQIAVRHRRRRLARVGAGELRYAGNEVRDLAHVLIGRRRDKQRVAADEVGRTGGVRPDGKR